MRKFTMMFVTLCAAMFFALPAMALETPIGLPQILYGMEIAAVYLQPIEMDPSTGPHAMRARKDSDIHIEADIRATENNPNGFASRRPSNAGCRQCL